MDPREQEKLFAKLRTAHPTWPLRFVSGYVHGARDESVRDRPPPVMARAGDEYALGYLTGFAMRRGEDAEHTGWFRFVSRVVKECRG